MSAMKRGSAKAATCTSVSNTWWRSRRLCDGARTAFSLRSNAAAGRQRRSRSPRGGRLRGNGGQIAGVVREQLAEFGDVQPEIKNPRCRRASAAEVKAAGIASADRATANDAPDECKAPWSGNLWEKSGKRPQRQVFAANNRAGEAAAKLTRCAAHASGHTFARECAQIRLRTFAIGASKRQLSRAEPASGERGGGGRQQDGRRRT